MNGQSNALKLCSENQSPPANFFFLFLWNSKAHCCIRHVKIGGADDGCHWVGLKGAGAAGHNNQETVQVTFLFTL